MPTRRDFLSGAMALYFGARLTPLWADESQFVNDIHSGLNRTRVARVVTPKSSAEVQELVQHAKAQRMSVSIAGGRHAMGGQQFGTDTVLVDMTKLNRLLHLDGDRGLLEVEAGIEWPQ